MKNPKSCQKEEELLLHPILRCSMVLNNTHECRALCQPNCGYGLCGRRAGHGPKQLPGQEQQVVLYVIPQHKVA